MCEKVVRSGLIKFDVNFQPNTYNIFISKFLGVFFCLESFRIMIIFVLFKRNRLTLDTINNQSNKIQRYFQFESCYTEL